MNENLLNFHQYKDFITRSTKTDPSIVVHTDDLDKYWISSYSDYLGQEYLKSEDLIENLQKEMLAETISISSEISSAITAARSNLDPTTSTEEQCEIYQQIIYKILNNKLKKFTSLEDTINKEAALLMDAFDGLDQLNDKYNNHFSTQPNNVEPSSIEI